MRGFLRYHIKDRLLLARDIRHVKSSRHNPLLVFTMAKVGSLSVHLSVKKTTPIPSFHIHSLDLDEIAMAEQRCFDQGTYPDSRNPAAFINESIIERGMPYKVVSLFRSPIERNISAFFEAFELMTGTTPEKYSGDLDELVSIFHAKVSHHYAIDWYGKHFEPATGINVYDHGFNKADGYGFINQGNCSALLIDSAVDDEIKEKVIGDFLKAPSFKLTNTNITADSSASALYDKFKAHIRFDQEYLNHLLDSQYFSHFFTQVEKEKSLEKWLKS